MIVLPSIRPKLHGLQNKYLKLWAFYEHCSRRFSAGLISASNKDEAYVLYFEAGETIRILVSKDGKMLSMTEEQFFSAVSKLELEVAVYELTEPEVYLWAEAAEAEVVYSGLSTEFVNIDGLFERLRKETHTGTIVVTLANGETAVVFLQAGEYFGSSFSWKPLAADGASVDRSPEAQQELRKRLTEISGTLNVYKKQNDVPKFQSNLAAPAITSKSSVAKTAAAPTEEVSREEISQKLSMLLTTVEKLFDQAGKKPEILIKEGFARDSLQYSFLDPFRGVLKYSQSSIVFTGSEKSALVYEGVTRSLKKTATAVGVDISDQLSAWKHAL